ncbi:hypothetical protein IAU60_000196 [Kwoniella sp. DSM 27419]
MSTTYQPFPNGAACCATEVCGAQYNLSKSVVNQAFGTTFCYLDAGAANYSYANYASGNCTNTGMACTDLTEFKTHNGAQGAMAPSGLLLGWVLGLYLLFMLNRH